MIESTAKNVVSSFRAPRRLSLSYGFMNERSMIAIICAWSFGLLAIASGEPATDARIDITRGRLPNMTDPEVRARVMALGGQNLKVTWRFGPVVLQQRKPVVIHIHRVTGARRVPLADVKLDALAEEVNWAWDVPVVKGPARYEVTLDLPTPVVLVIEAIDSESHEAALKALKRAKITTTGTKDVELAALREMGLKPTTGRTAAGSDEALVLIETNGEGGGWRREIHFSGDAPSEVIWASGPGPNDWRVRVPRIWISPEALATTEGRVRLVECMVDPPHVP